MLLNPKHEIIQDVKLFFIKNIFFVFQSPYNKIEWMVNGNCWTIRRFNAFKRI